jgi:pyruvate formate lyase activating enzyme
VVTGGEPTAAASLMRLLEGLSATRLPVKLDTNGAAPDVLAAALAGGLVSYVALDVKTTPERYDRLTGGSEVWERVEHSIAAILASGIDHEFKTTCYPFGVSAADLPSMAARLAGGRRYILQQFVARRTLDPGAASARPWAADELRRAALCCAVHIPTVVRGV